MDAAQQLAFQEGTGNFFQAGDLLWALQAISATAVFLYVSWLCVNAYKDYGEEQISASDMMTVWIRGVAVMMVLLYLIVK